mgnify:CR=1 FL=1
MPSPTDFNLSPYYDDFAESKKFHRILFRPSFAVQARELTQSQSILQNQIEKVSDHLFEKGAMVIPGEIGYDLNYYSVKLTSFTDSAAVGVTLTDFVGLRLTGATSGVTAKVINTDATDGTDPNTLYVKYENSGTNNAEVKFTAGETISVSTTLQSTITTVSAVVNTCHTGAAAYVGASLITRQDGSKQINISVKALKPRDGVYFMEHVLVAAQNTGKLSDLTQDVTLETGGGGLSIRFG